MSAARGPAVVLVVSQRSGAGKTTLVERLIPALRALGVRCAAVKLTHHDVELDPPGKDTRRLRDAGAEAVVLSGPSRLTAFGGPGTGGTGGGGGAGLERAIAVAALLGGSPQVILVEGGRSVPGFPRIEVVAPGDGPISAPETLLAIAAAAPSDFAAGGGSLALSAGAPVLARDDYAGLAALVAARAAGDGVT